MKKLLFVLTFIAVMAVRPSGAPITGNATTLLIKYGADSQVSLNVPAGLDAGIQYAMSIANAQRAAQTPPVAAYANTTAYLQDVITNAVTDYRRQWKDAQRSSIAAAIESASNAQLNNAATALGVTLP